MLLLPLILLRVLFLPPPAAAAVVAAPLEQELLLRVCKRERQEPSTARFNKKHVAPLFYKLI